MKKSFKLMIPLMALAMILSLCACSGKNAEGSAAIGDLAASPAAVAEQTEFDVVLVGFDDDASKIQLIKVVREITDMGLAEAKAAVDAAEDNTPKTLMEAVSKDEAEEMKKKIEEAGGKVELK
ncbi:MAG: 50S ribosomal protein L7/L12 [Oscillospiraceae bacterium]|nr:50S ribosomal protein L7/L12 [Oscillospiraceae bacterium]MDE7172387.1 50S ribosomal protein L7/L12 [Oscillospiraceae bacterium]